MSKTNQEPPVLQIVDLRDCPFNDYPFLTILSDPRFSGVMPSDWAPDPAFLKYGEEYVIDIYNNSHSSYDIYIMRNSSYEGFICLRPQIKEVEDSELSKVVKKQIVLSPEPSVKRPIKSLKTEVVQASLIEWALIHARSEIVENGECGTVKVLTIFTPSAYFLELDKLKYFHKSKAGKYPKGVAECIIWWMDKIRDQINRLEELGIKIIFKERGMHHFATVVWEREGLI